MKWILKKDIVLPTKKISEGVSKTEQEWMIEIAGLSEGDCSIKTDWFQTDLKSMALEELDRRLENIEISQIIIHSVMGSKDDYLRIDGFYPCENYEISITVKKANYGAV